MRLKMWVKFFATLLIVFALDAWFTFAPAFSPVPRQRVESHSQEHPNSKEYAQSSQQPSDWSLSINSEMHAGSKAEHANDGASETERKVVTVVGVPQVAIAGHSGFWGWISDWNQAIFNGLLFVVGALQAVLLWRTWDRIKRQASLLSRQNTIVLAAAQAATEQAKISRQTLVAQFRPKIVVRRMKLDPSAVIYFDRRADGKWMLELQLHNAGGTVAHVRSCIAWFQRYDGGAQTPRETIAALTVEQPFDIPAGGKYQMDLALPPERMRKILVAIGVDKELEENTGGEIPGDFLAYNGTIIYADDNGLVRETGFSRNWFFRGQKFIASTDPDYEYQE